ncbi:uncharacterized protein V1513DRAFT_441942 [Lipomyces chichibuensis]|uniref:uncharacterized protein n=1 Tax=Lipomyces chichibuensis TaxID=1546026 RepID=UPI003342F5D0
MMDTSSLLTRESYVAVANGVSARPEIRYPPGYTNERVKQFIAQFFALADDAQKDEEYVNFFADSAFYIVGLKTAAGRAEIFRLRQILWKHIMSRRHEIDVVFPFTQVSAASQAACGLLHDNLTDGSLELAIFGRINYVMEPSNQASNGTNTNPGANGAMYSSTPPASPSSLPEATMTIEFASRMLLSLTDMKIVFYHVYPSTATLVDEETDGPTTAPVVDQSHRMLPLTNGPNMNASTNPPPLPRW